MGETTYHAELAEAAVERWWRGGFDTLEEALSELTEARTAVASGPLSTRLDEALANIQALLVEAAGGASATKRPATPKPAKKAAKPRAAKAKPASRPRSERHAALRAELGGIAEPCGYLTIYFSGPLANARAGVRRVLDHHLAVELPFLRWYEVGGNHRWLKLASKAFQLLWSVVDEGTEGDYSFELAGERADSGFRFRYMPDRQRGPTARHPPVGELRLRWPLESLDDRPDVLREAARLALEALPVLGGHGGYSLESDLEQSATLMRTLRRYPGASKQVNFVEIAHLGIEGVNWLTILGRSWAGRWQPAGLSSDVRTEAREDGVVIQAGDRPSFGSRAERPPACVEVGRRLAALRPHPDAFGLLTHISEYASDREEWLARFDAALAPEVSRRWDFEELLEARIEDVASGREIAIAELEPVIRAMPELAGATLSRFLQLFGAIVKRDDEASRWLITETARLRLDAAIYDRIIRTHASSNLQLVVVLGEALGSFLEDHPELDHAIGRAHAAGGARDVAIAHLFKAKDRGLYADERFRRELAVCERWLGTHPRWADLVAPAPA